MNAVLDAVRELRVLTEAQVAAARGLRGAELARLTTARTDALFALRVALSPGEAVATEGDELVAETALLAHAEQRLAAVGRLVLDVLDRAGAQRPSPVYGPTGRVGG